MSQQTPSSSSFDRTSQSDASPLKALIVNIGAHYFGTIIDNIQDVIQRNPTTPVPLAPDNIIGLLNLRGHIVTEIDVARTLEIEDESGIEAEKGYSVVINKENEMYSLVFEEVGDVVDIPYSSIEKLPDTIQKKWFTVSKGVYRMDEKLIVLLDFNLLIDHLTPDSQPL